MESTRVMLDALADPSMLASHPFRAPVGCMPEGAGKNCSPGTAKTFRFGSGGWPWEGNRPRCRHGSGVSHERKGDRFFR
jgi:hypothetical protein